MENAKKKQAYIAAFAAYWIVVLYFTFFGMRSVGELAADANLREHSNFIPFATIVGYFLALGRQTVGGAVVARNLLGNLLMALPCGILLPAIFSRLRWASAAVVTTICVNFVLEFFQLIFKVGSFDIDSLLLRGIGALLGYLIWKQIAGKSQDTE